MTSMAASTSTIGSRRRAAAIASPSRVCAFSRANNASRASCQVLLSTTGGRAGLGAWSFMIASMRSLAGLPTDERHHTGFNNRPVVLRPHDEVRNQHATAETRPPPGSAGQIYGEGLQHHDERAVCKSLCRTYPHTHGRRESGARNRAPGSPQVSALLRVSTIESLGLRLRLE